MLNRIAMTTFVMILPGAHASVTGTEFPQMIVL
jgi:hypothetical protein